jgi:hypothetical protein
VAILQAVLPATQSIGVVFYVCSRILPGMLVEVRLDSVQHAATEGGHFPEFCY